MNNQLELVQMYIDNKVRWCLLIQEGYLRTKVLPLTVHSKCRSLSTDEYHGAEVAYGDLTASVAQKFLDVTRPGPKLVEQLEKIANDATR